MLLTNNVQILELVMGMSRVCIADVHFWQVRISLLRFFCQSVIDNGMFMGALYCYLVTEFSFVMVALCFIFALTTIVHVHTFEPSDRCIWFCGYCAGYDEILVFAYSQRFTLWDGNNRGIYKTVDWNRQKLVGVFLFRDVKTQELDKKYWSSSKVLKCS